MPLRQQRRVQTARESRERIVDPDPSAADPAKSSAAALLSRPWMEDSASPWCCCAARRSRSRRRHHRRECGDLVCSAVSSSSLAFEGGMSAGACATTASRGRLGERAAGLAERGRRRGVDGLERWRRRPQLADHTPLRSREGQAARRAARRAARDRDLQRRARGRPDRTLRPNEPVWTRCSRSAPPTRARPRLATIEVRDKLPTPRYARGRARRERAAAARRRRRRGDRRGGRGRAAAGPNDELLGRRWPTSPVSAAAARGR